MPRPPEQVSEDFNADQARELASAYHINKENASRAQLLKVLAQIKAVITGGGYSTLEVSWK